MTIITTKRELPIIISVEIKLRG